jgi:membrane fusion protein, multidrug efflux system
MKVNACLIVFVLLVGCTETPADDQGPPQAVRAVEVRQGPVLEGRRYLAEVVPERTIRVLAQVPGAISELSAAEGISVEQGSSLVYISAPDIAARISRVRAERLRAEQERNLVCRRLATDRVLAEAGDLAPVQLDRSETTCASAELVVEAARAAEREAGVAGTRAVERSPFAGEVLEQLVDEGQTVMPGTPLLQFGSRERLLQIRMPEGDLADIDLGTRAEFAAGSGRVVAIGAQAQGPGRLFELLVEPDEATSQRPGTTLTATLIVDEREDATSVPEASVAQDEAGAYVLVIEESVLRRVDVRTGPQQDGWVAIEPRLAAGTFVVSGALSILDVTQPVLAVTP